MTTTQWVEATNGVNWGKFLVQQFDDQDWAYESAVDGRPLLTRRWDQGHLIVFDVETGEGALFRHGGHAKADLDKHRIWVCPLFEPFLEWLYEQEVSDLEHLPSMVHLPDAPAHMHGYRRPGPTE